MRSLFPPVKRIVFQILFLLLCYFCSRTVFTFINTDYFRNITTGKFLYLSWQALRFDLSAILTVNALYILLLLLPVPVWRMPRWQKFTQWVFITVNILAFAFEIADWAYFPFTLKRSTVDVLDMVTRKGDFWPLLPHFIIDYWYAPLGFVLYIWLFIKGNKWICRKTPIITSPDLSMNWVIGLWQTVVLVAVLGLCVIGIRGGLQYIPIGNSNALQVTDNEHVPIVLNTPFSIIHSLEARQLEELHYFDSTALYGYIQPVKEFSGSTFRKKNVVFIIVESLSKNLTGLGSTKSYTPFLDSLMKQSYVFGNAYANALHSAEGIPAIVSGLPSMMEEPITTSFYSTDKLTSLPSLLKEEGYQTAFYHGGTNGTMSFDIYAANAGFQKYFGRSEYRNEKDYDGNWGIWDEPFLQYSAKGLSTIQQPFMASVFTLSSHDPFKVPERYKNILPKGDIPMQQCAAYTDLAIRKFFENAAQQPWFNNTLFVITADHASPVAGINNQTAMGMYEIPVIFYAPGDSALKGSNEKIFQQIDILPSVMDYLGYNKPFFAFGNTAFRRAEPRFVINEISDSYKWLMEDQLLICSNMQTATICNYKTDSMCRTKRPVRLENSQDRIARYFKAFVQLYRSSLIHNKLSVQ